MRTLEAQMRHSLFRFVLVVTFVTGSALPALAQQWGTGLEVGDYKTIPYLIESLTGQNPSAALKIRS